MEHTIDWTYADLQDVTAEKIVEIYNCTNEEAVEAMRYIAYFMQDVQEEFPDALQILDKIDKLGEPR
jgi:ferritin